MKAAHNIFYAHGFGNVAPWFDLANSEEWDGFGKRTDHLNDREWLAAFWKHWKLAPISFDSPSRRRLQDLRELLRRAAQKLAAGHSLGTGEITKLNHALNVPVRQRLLPRPKWWRAEPPSKQKGGHVGPARISASLA